MMSESLFISGQGVYEALFLTDSVAKFERIIDSLFTFNMAIP